MTQLAPPDAPALAAQASAYAFGDWMLDSGGHLCCGELCLRLPPKELAVLQLLLQADGRLLSKDQLLSAVWPDSCIGEESLTRCIYALRRLLKQGGGPDSIQTVYGKGYRLSCASIALAGTGDAPRRVLLAVLPFASSSRLDLPRLHAGLIRGLASLAEGGLQVLPAALTRDCRDRSAILELVGRLRPDVYLAGQLHDGSGKSVLTLELVRAIDHLLLQQAWIEIDHPRDISALQARVGALLARHVPGLLPPAASWPRHGPSKNLHGYLRARQALRRWTPTSLRQALDLLCQGEAGAAGCAAWHSALAETYLGLAQLGLFAPQRALAHAQQALRHALQLELGHAPAQSLLGLLQALRGDSSLAALLLEQAAQLDPDAPAPLYGQAWNLALQGQVDAALRTLQGCLRRDPAHVPAILLRSWLLAGLGRNAAAIGTLRQALSGHTPDHPVLQSRLATLLAGQGRLAEAQAQLAQLRSSGELMGMLAADAAWVCGLAGQQQDLSTLDAGQLGPCLLPLLLQRQGQRSALRLWSRLQRQRAPGLALWRIEPRLRELFHPHDRAQTPH